MTAQWYMAALILLLSFSLLVCLYVLMLEPVEGDE